MSVYGPCMPSDVCATTFPKKTKLIHVCMYIESKSVGPYKSRGTFGIIVSGLVWYIITRFIAGRLCPPLSCVRGLFLI